ncbi:MAG: ParA family protein [Anaerolineales bacterium]|nr:ParA family protein [Anaerolineales bacterium]
MKIYAIVNQKGGVGKTTSVISLAAYLAQNYRVLVVDIDPQANATSGMGFDKTEDHPSVYDVLLGDTAVYDAIVRHDNLKNIDVLPSAPGLAGAEVELVSTIGREYRLRERLSQVEDRYDYVLIDCPPSLGLLTINALTAARDGVLIPVQCEYLALEGLSQLAQTVQMVKQYLNPTLEIRGLIMTMYDSRTNLSRQVVEEVKNYFPGKVFRAIIPRNVRLSEAPSYGEPINVYAPTSSGALAYKYLAAEIIKGDAVAA